MFPMAAPSPVAGLDHVGVADGPAVVVPEVRRRLRVRVKPPGRVWVTLCPLPLLTEVAVKSARLIQQILSR